MVGAPTGVPVTLAALLGDRRPINRCFAPIGPSAGNGASILRPSNVRRAVATNRLLQSLRTNAP
jgi:hypothetical protein